MTEIDTSAATGGTFGAAVAALDAASFSSIDTDVLDANSVIAREVQVFPSGATPPTISGTTLAGAGIDLKQDGDLYVGNYSDDKYMFWDQSEGTMTFRGTLNVDDITGSSATFGTLMAEVATIGTLNTKMLDSDAIVTRDIRVGPSLEKTAGSFTLTDEFYITELGNTNWNTVAGTSGVDYNIGSIFTVANAGTGTGKARDRSTVAKIAGATLTGTGAHLNSDGDFYLGDASTNRYMFWDQSAGTMTLRGSLNASDITAGTMTAVSLKGGTIPEASSAPTGTEAGAFLDLGNGRMVFGNASKYIWWDGTNLAINGVTISNATLQQATGVATETYVDDAITALLGGAPDALNTLNELAAALDDDADFHTAVTTSLGNKVGTTSSQALANVGNALTISGSTITLARANGTTDVVAVPNTNTQRSDEEIRDLAAGIITAGTNISVVKNDAANTVTIASTDTNTQRSDEEIRDLAAGIITAGTNISVVKNDAANTVTIASSFSNTQRTDEEIRDVAAAMITAGTNVTVSSNDAANTVTIASTDTNTQYSAGSGLSLSGTTFSNSAPDRTVTLTGGGTTSNGEGYITNADDGDAATFGGSLPSAYVTTDHLQALGSQANAMTNSGSTVTLRRGDGSTDVVISDIPQRAYMPL